MCNITTEAGIAMLTSVLWNTTEEKLNQSVRDLMYRSQYQNVPLFDVLLNHHNKTREAIIQKLDNLATVSNTDLLLTDQMITGHETMSYMSVRQLCCAHESLNVKSEEGIYVLYARSYVKNERGICWCQKSST